MWFENVELAANSVRNSEGGSKPGVNFIEKEIRLYRMRSF